MTTATTDKPTTEPETTPKGVMLPSREQVEAEIERLESELKRLRKIRRFLGGLDD